jgi:hypothetical protein
MLGRSPGTVPRLVGFGKLLHGGDGACLLHHAQRIAVVPGFYKLSAREAGYAYAPYRHLVATRLYTHRLALTGAKRRPQRVAILSPSAT